MTKDTLFSKPQKAIKDFVFDDNVAAVFDDMISRSVPLYQDIQATTAKLAAHIVPPGGTVYDLGCSTGTTLVLLHRALESKQPRLIGVDNSASMLRKCKDKLAQANISDIELIHGDITSVPLGSAALVIMNYTLQFVPIEQRLSLLKNICQVLRPNNGALLMSEKVAHQGERTHKLLVNAYHEFKRDQGYSELEIAQKRDALENVLVPITTEENILLLEQAGFCEVALYAKWYNFAALVAVS